MTAKQRRRFYQTPAWRSMSRHIRQRDGWLCQSCLPRTVGATLVHHVVPLSENGEPLTESNLTSLCADCHRSAHSQVVDQGRQEWKRYIENLMERF